MPYIQKTYKAGDIVVVGKYYSSRYGSKGIARGERKSQTREAVARLNEQRAEFKLWLLLKSNFKANDIHLVLTYKKENRPTKEAAKKHMAKFLRSCRAIYKGQGRELRYVWVCEYENSAIHFHIILPQIDPVLLSAFWPYGMARPTYMYEEGNYKALSAYLVKETKRTRQTKSVSGKLYNTSKNLVQPQVETKIITADRWLKSPKVPKGYTLLGEPNTGFSEITGTPYQYYHLQRIAKSHRKKQENDMEE